MNALPVRTYAELYHKLVCLDNEHRMYPLDAGSFEIRLNHQYSISVYDNEREVYLEYNKNGKQMTHYHPEYQEAYDDLADVLADPHKALKELEMVTEIRRKNTVRWTAAAALISFVLLLISGLFAGH